MNHLVVGQHQDIVLAGEIGQAEGHAVVVVLAEIGVQLHVFQEIVHPAHVPLEGETQAVHLRVVRHLGPGGGLLGDHHSAAVAAAQHGV